MNQDTNYIFKAYGKVLVKEDIEQELGVDPKDVAEYDQLKKDICYDNYPFWDAYHAVKEGAWSEEDFHQWASSVWAAGADESQNYHS